jgi:acyl CoA:acetate/3-ketoacid CoA transferase alpha subunit
MISQLSGKDIIISYMSKSGKTIWLKSIERAHAGPERIRYIYKKETKDLCLVYEDNIEGTGMYYSKVNIDSTISASIPIIPKLRLFGNNRFAAENEIIVSDVSKGKITFAVITF